MTAGEGFLVERAADGASVFVFRSRTGRGDAQTSLVFRWEHVLDSLTSQGDAQRMRVLVPGVLYSTTNFLEHPRLIAQRLGRFAEIVGRDRMIAGTDCGFGTFARLRGCRCDIVYARSRAMADGAAIASRQRGSEPDGGQSSQ